MRYGDITVIPLPKDRQSEVTIQPRRVELEPGQSGSRRFTVNGGELGLILDARGRPWRFRGHDEVAMRSVERGNAMFGADAERVRSEAIIRMPADAPLPYGLLLLGHGEPSEFDARHTAHLLGFLGASLSAMMRRWLIDR